MRRVMLVLWGVLAITGYVLADELTWSSYNGHDYALTEATGNWLEVQAEAESHGGDLVTINSQAEQDWLQATFAPQVEHNVWIGFYQPPGTPEPDEGWEWISGEAVTYTNWSDGQPNEIFEGDDYAAMDTATAPLGHWHDIPLEGWDGPHYGIVEVPEPATLSLLVIGGLTLVRRRKMVRRGSP